MKHKIVLLGDSSVGKTAITNRFIYNSFNENESPTVGAGFLSKTIQFDGIDHEIQLWDTAGEEKFKSMAPIHVHNSELAIIVFDITKKETFDHVISWYRISQSCASMPVIIIGNKADLDPKIIEVEQIIDYCENFHAPFFEVSALTGVGITECFIEALNIIVRESEIAQKLKCEEGTIELSEIPRSRKKCLC